jgi:enolase
VGSMTRSERTAKWNEVIRIAEGVAATGYWRFKVP